MRHALALALAVVVPVLAVPGAAHGQYKNTAFGLDAGYWMITRPSAVDPSTNAVYTNDSLPLRLAYGFRVGGESNFKLDEDHWWFTARVNVGILKFSSGSTAAGASLDDQFDAQADQTLGTIVGFEGQIGVRYVILTDRVRPYVQGALSYMRLVSFSSLASDGCDVTVCGTDTSNEEAYLRHPNVGAVHLQPGIELILQRDLALHLYVDAQRWLLLNTTGNWAFVGGIGIIFFT